MSGLVVDLFAGGGGTSLGLKWAFGRSPDIAINHDHEALAMHEANHPETNHYAEVRAFLTRYNGTAIGQQLDLPSSTIDANDRLGLVMVDGVPHAITDIGMRMLIARELFRCQGFPDSYKIEVECERHVRGKLVRGVLPADAQVRMCGNSVPPQFAEAIAAANAPAIARERVA